MKQYAVTTIDGVLKADWQSTLTLARLADETNRPVALIPRVTRGPIRQT